MKQQVLKRARNRVEACLHEQSAGAGLDVLSVDVKVDGDGDEFLWVYLKYDDGNGAGGLPDTDARIRLTDRLHSERRGRRGRRLPRLLVRRRVGRRVGAGVASWIRITSCR